MKGRDPKTQGGVFDIVKTIGYMDIAYLARAALDSRRAS